MLSSLGERQARLLGERLAAQGMRFDAAIAGGLERQRRTAHIVQGAYRDAGLPFPEITADPSWNEFDLGAVYQQVADPIARADPEFAKLWAEMVRDMQNEHAGVHRLHNYCDIAVVRAWVAKTHPYDGESWEAFRAPSKKRCIRCTPTHGRAARSPCSPRRRRLASRSARR